MKIVIMVISGFSMLVKSRITVTDINEKNLNSGSGFCILFYNKNKNIVICLDNYAQYQRTYPSLLVKYKNRTYKTSSSRGGSNMDFNLITCRDKLIMRHYSKATY